MRALTAQEVGQLLRSRRVEFGLTQQKLAARAGVARSSLSLLERGHERAELGVLLRLLRSLDLVMDLTTVYLPDDLDAHVESFDEPHVAKPE